MILAGKNKYPTYRESGVVWIDEIPEAWGVQKLKHVACVNLSNVDKKSNDDEHAVRLCNYVDVYYNDFIAASMDFMQATASPDQIEKFTLRQGDVLITKDSEDWNDIAVPAYVSQDCDGILCGYHLAHIRPDEEFIDGRYLFRAFNASPLYEQFRVSANGITRYGVGKYSIENSLFLLPPITEQQAIADYLDAKTALIDELIGKKRRQIELLKEQRQAVINQAVTKGLDPNVEMKDSGTYWLGEAPKSWTLKKFSFCTSIRSGQVDPSVEPYCDMPLIAPNHIESKTGKVIHIETAKEQGADSGKYLFEEGEVLYSKIRPHLQKVCIAPVNGICSADMYAIKPTDELLNTFLAYFMLTEVFTAYTVDMSMRVAMPKINRDDLTRSCIAFPDKAGQEAIVEFIGTETDKIDQSVRKAERQIELLQEYRRALISEAVTGKIDVREAG